LGDGAVLLGFDSSNGGKLATGATTSAISGFNSTGSTVATTNTTLTSTITGYTGGVLLTHSGATYNPTTHKLTTTAAETALFAGVSGNGAVTKATAIAP
jgi:hypothetical protein